MTFYTFGGAKGQIQIDQSTKLPENKFKNTILCILSHIITRNIVEYIILTLGIIQGHI